jgi:hypothetical protein
VEQKKILLDSLLEEAKRDQHFLSVLREIISMNNEIESQPKNLSQDIKNAMDNKHMILFQEAFPSKKGLLFLRVKLLLIFLTIGNDEMVKKIIDDIKNQHNIGELTIISKDGVNTISLDRLILMKDSKVLESWSSGRIIVSSLSDLLTSFSDLLYDSGVSSLNVIVLLALFYVFKGQI